MILNRTQRAILLTTFAFAALVALTIALSPGYAGDIKYYKLWTRLIVQSGLAQAYSGTFPDTYSIYPPVTLSFYWLIGWLYQRLLDPTFALQQALDSHLLTYLLKLPAVAFHLLTASAIFGIALRWTTFPRAYVALVIYAFNPAVLFDIAHWGQPDSIHAFFALMALAAIGRERFGLAWLWMGLALWAKPQAWALLPLIVFLTVQQGGFRGLIRGGLIVAGVTALVSLPFFIGGTIDQLAGLPAGITSARASISVNAHNLWWLKFGAQAPFTPDSLAAVKSLSYRGAALLMWALLYIVALASLVRQRAEPHRYLIAAFVSLAFFGVMTQIHENHLFQLFPFLAVVAVFGGIPAAFYGLLTVSLLGNMLLHDPLLLPWLTRLLSSETLEWLRMSNALLIIGTLTLWAVWLVARALGPVRALTPRQAEAPGLSQD
ncbi:MAG: hypothetical protein HYX89_05915 [Chloroflexi bacterium]|nr:hypothetical protein [Chloroflexota bacterium]